MSVGLFSSGGGYDQNRAWKQRQEHTLMIKLDLKSFLQFTTCYSVFVLKTALIKGHTLFSFFNFNVILLLFFLSHVPLGQKSIIQKPL